MTHKRSALPEVYVNKMKNLPKTITCIISLFKVLWLNDKRTRVVFQYV